MTDLSAIYRRCDLWHHMFTKEPPSLDVLQTQFVNSSMEENIKSYILWRLHCQIFINFGYDERVQISKLVQLLLPNSWIYVEIMTQNVNFPI